MARIGAGRLTDRKDALRDLLENRRGGALGAHPDQFIAHGSEVFKQACDNTLEGVISKRGDLPYYEGRTRDWLKTK